jgi:hypothetical protein
MKGFISTAGKGNSRQRSLSNRKIIEIKKGEA